MICVLLLAGCDRTAPPPVILISVTGNPAQLILAAWAEGRVVWSADAINGGGPLKTAKIPPDKIIAAMRQIAAAGFFDPALKRKYIGEGSPFTAFAVRSGGESFKLESWHELIEQNGRRVATARGVMALDAGTAVEVLVNQPADYHRFRKVWDAARHAAMDLIPESGEPCEMPSLN